MFLNELKPGTHASIHSLLADEKDDKENGNQHLYEMGFLPGEKIQLIRKAPWGGPIVVRIMDYELCLRQDCAASIRVQNIEN